MKQILIIALTIAVLASCNKKELPPVTGYNSELNIEGITFYRMLYADSIKAFVSMEFLVRNDTSATPDTVQLQQSYKVEQSPSNQKVYFNTPANTQLVTLNFSFRMYNGQADSMHIDKVTYKRDGNSYLGTPLYFSLMNDIFQTPAISLSF